MKPLTVAVVATLCAASMTGAQTEPLDGQHPPGSHQSIADLQAQLVYQRAFEAVLWAMPATAIYGFRVGLLAQPPCG